MNELERLNKEGCMFGQKTEWRVTEVEKDMNGLGGRVDKVCEKLSKIQLLLLANLFSLAIGMALLLLKK